MDFRSTQPWYGSYYVYITMKSVISGRIKIENTVELIARVLSGVGE